MNFEDQLREEQFDHLACHEIDESDFDHERPDLAPLQLEQRGITEQETSRNDTDSVDQNQFSLWSAATIHKNTVAAKLRQAGLTELAATLEHCHTIPTYALCTNCGRHQRFMNRCDNFICPECAPRRSNDRKRAVQWWSARISQPKHVTLTVKNTVEITKGHVQEFKRWFKNLRRSKFCGNWQGGFYTIEITNEGKGWHLHIHCLVDAVWIDAIGLSSAWIKATNGMGRIVKVKSARCESYLKQVTKYLVKGNQLAAWSPSQLAEFYGAFDGLRTFGVFGSLYGKRTEFAEWFKAMRDQKPACKCGCRDQIIFSEFAWLSRDLTSNPVTEPRPPPPDYTQQILSRDFATNTAPPA